MKQLLWIGCLESDEEFKIKAKKGYDLASAQVSQQNLLKGIEQVSGLVFDSINGSVLPPYPIYEDRDILPVTWHHVDDAFDISVGYRNDRYINRVNCKNAMLRSAEGWINKRYHGGELTVLVYSMRSAPMATACQIKKLIPQAKIYLVVTDLPQFMDLGQSKIKALLKKIDWVSIKKMQNQFDGFIIYAGKMAEFLKIINDKWMLMEGSFDAAESEILVGNTAENHKKRAIMYSGKLDLQYGIKLLLDAFMEMDGNNLELWLTGGGNAESYIRECASKDGRIKFYGFLPTRYNVLKKQREASLLINMRLPSEEASNYCFPSKLFEYMATGIPVLTFKLGGIPEDYYQYLVMIDAENICSIKTAIKETMRMSDKERDSLGQRAKLFVIDNKKISKQCKRIATFIDLGKDVRE